MEGRKRVYRRGPQKSMVRAFPENLQQSGMCRFRCRSDGFFEKLRSLKQHAVQKLRETVVPCDHARNHRANETVEQAIWEVQSIARTLDS